MLEYAWFFLLMVLSVVFALFAETREQRGDSVASGHWQIVAHCAALLAIGISWDRTGGVLLITVLDHLPQGGAGIVELIGYTILGVACLLVILGIPIIAMEMAHMLRIFLRSKKRLDAMQAQPNETATTDWSGRGAR